MDLDSAKPPPPTPAVSTQALQMLQQQPPFPILDNATGHQVLSFLAEQYHSGVLQSVAIEL